MINEKKNQLHLQRLLDIDNWLLKRNFKKVKSALVPMMTDNKKLWEEIQKNPQMTENQFLKIAEQIQQNNSQKKMIQILKKSPEITEKEMLPQVTKILK